MVNNQKEVKINRNSADNFILRREIILRRILSKETASEISICVDNINT